MSDETKRVFKKPAVVYVKPITTYLRKLKKTENTKPRKLQKYVPKLKELAEIVGIPIGSLSYLSRAKSLNLSHAAAVITAMHRLDFPMEITDIIDFIPPEFAKVEPKEELPASSKPIEIKVLTSEYLNANDEQREAMREAMPLVITMIERHIAQQVAEAMG